MAVRVPRVAVEAVVAVALIGAGCFMLLDLSGKQGATFVANGGAIFSAKLTGKFSQMATQQPAILPTICTGTETTDPVPGICNLLSGQSVCCTTTSLDTQLPPDLSNCTSRCASYYTAFYCFYKCKNQPYTTPGAQKGVCRTQLQTMFDACNTQTCKILNTGDMVSAETDFNAFVGANTIFTQTTEQGCNDFTQFGRRCEESAPPTVKAVKAYYDENDANVNDDLTPVTSITNSAARPFTTPASGTSGTGAGQTIRICADVSNPRPTDCTTQPAGGMVYPLYVNIFVQASGPGFVAYMVANTTVASQDLQLIAGTGAQPNFYRACVNDIRILPFNRAAYTLAVSVAAVNTYGTGSSSSLDATQNSVSIPVSVPANAGNFAGAYSLTSDVDVCATMPTSATTMLVGSNTWAVPMDSVSSFTVPTINCCEGVNQNGFRPECNIVGTGSTNPLMVTTFNANPVSTTLMQVVLVVTDVFAAKGAISLVNSKIQVTGTATTSGFRVTTVPVALRGDAATQLVIATGSRLVVDGTNNFLITLGTLEVLANPNAVISVNMGRLVIAETTRLTSQSAQYLITNRGRLVQYTTFPGGIYLYATDNDVAFTGSTAPETAGKPVTGVVAVSGILTTYNNPTKPAGVNYLPVETRISLGRGPTAPADDTADTKGDNTAVPMNADIPGQTPGTFMTPTANKFGTQVAVPPSARATIQACGTVHSLLTIPSTGTLLISPPAGYTGTRCQVVGALNSIQVDNLNVASGGQIVITNVDSTTFLPIRVAGTFSVSQAANIIVQLSPTITTLGIPSLQLFDISGATSGTTTDICSMLPNIEIRDAGDRVVSPSCNSNAIALTFTPVTTAPPPQVNVGLFTSANQYCVELRQNIALFTRDAFNMAVTNNFSPQTTGNDINVTAAFTDPANPDNIKVYFRCYDVSSVLNGDNKCQNIVNSAGVPSSGFRAATNAAGGCTAVSANPPEDTDNSNHGLYGLLGMVAIPILLLLALFLILRNSRRRADNQYMQDAATFSNVSSGPQPIAAQPVQQSPMQSVGYDMTKEVHPTEEIYPAIQYPTPGYAY